MPTDLRLFPGCVNSTGGTGKACRFSPSPSESEESCGDISREDPDSPELSSLSDTVASDVYWSL